MGRGIRSNSDFCVVLLCGNKLTQAVMKGQKKEFFHTVTQKQLELSRIVTEHATSEESQVSKFEIVNELISYCLKRDGSWIETSRTFLLNGQVAKQIELESPLPLLRKAIDLARHGDFEHSETILQKEINEIEDSDLKAWLYVRLAEIKNYTDPKEAQRILRKARSLNLSVIRPIAPLRIRKLERTSVSQIERIQKVYREEFRDSDDWSIEVRSIQDDLRFEENSFDDFENAVNRFGEFIGLNACRPEKEYGKGPDNLWIFPQQYCYVIEAKNGVTSDRGISKTELGQLQQSVSWVKEHHMPERTVVPIIIHPSRHLDDKASMVKGLRVITKEQVRLMGELLVKFYDWLSDKEALSDEKRIFEMLSELSFTEKTFLTKFTVNPKI